MLTAAARPLQQQSQSVSRKLSFVRRRGFVWNRCWRSYCGVKTFKDQRLRHRHERVAVIKASIRLALKRNMDMLETLGLESLDLKKSKPPRDYPKRRANRRKGRVEGNQISRDNSLRDVSGQYSSAHVHKHKPTVASYGPFQSPPLATSTDERNCLTPYALRSVPQPLTYRPGQHFVPSSELANVPYQHPAQKKVTLNDRSILASHISGPCPFVQKSTLSVPAHHRYLPPHIDKRYRHTKTDIAKTVRIAVDQQTGSWDAPPISSPRKEKAHHKIRRNQNPLIHVPPPNPTRSYLSQAQTPPALLPSPQRLLLVLDLNGTLLYRNRASTRASQFYHPRPSLITFLDYALTNHHILIWSSARPHNVETICSRLFTPNQRSLFIGEWARDTLGLTPTQYNERVQVYKKLDRVWNDKTLSQNPGSSWGQHNTLLIDDSALKASAQPYNHIEIPEFVKGSGNEGEGEGDGDGTSVLGAVAGYLEEARRYSDVSAFGRVMKFSVDGGWKYDWGAVKGDVEGRQQERERSVVVVADDVDDEDDDATDDDDSGGGVRI